MPKPKIATTPITHYENFPVASWLCPPTLRPAITAIYHFARTADDIADEGTASAAQRIADLHAYRADLVQACGHAASSAISQRWPHIFEPLRAAVDAHKLPPPLLHDLLDAFVQDVEMTRDAADYATEAELLDYCRRSANPVGRLLLHLYGEQSAQANAQSDCICTALQLINFWQDLGVDIARQRFYLPREQCQRFGVARADLLALQQTPSTTKLIAACAHTARSCMEKGQGLVHTLPGRAGWELRLVIQGGLRILDRMQAMGFATLTRRPTLGPWDYAVMFWRALWM